MARPLLTREGLPGFLAAATAVPISFSAMSNPAIAAIFVAQTRPNCRLPRGGTFSSCEKIWQEYSSLGSWHGATTALPLRPWIPGLLLIASIGLIIAYCVPFVSSLVRGGSVALAPVGSPGLAEEHVSIIGAGIVGVCCASFLRLANIPVTLFDRGDPGAGCSSGNAGMLGMDSCVPLALPGVIKKIPSLLRSGDGPLGIDASQIPAALTWFLHFVREGHSARVAANARALHALQRHLPECYQILLQAAGAEDLIRRQGKLHLCESEAAFTESQPARDIQRDHDVEMMLLDPPDVIQLVPTLTRNIHRGIFYPNAFHSIDPHGMVARFAQDLRTRGGVLVQDEIRDIEIGPTGPVRLIGAAANYPVRRLVIAGGIDSARLAAKFGLRAPMIAHRGYNVTLRGAELRLPVKSEDRKIVLTPMSDGIRVTGIAEIAAPTKPPTSRYGDQLSIHARALVPGLTRQSTDLWVGSRPCTPDSLPILGRCARFPDVIYAFGHGHLGLGLGAVTGRIVCQLLAGVKPLADLSPYRPDRFRLWQDGLYRAPDS